MKAGVPLTPSEMVRSPEPAVDGVTVNWVGSCGKERDERTVQSRKDGVRTNAR